MSYTIENSNKRVRLQLICGLVLFLFSCNQETDKNRFISFQWEEGKATHLYIPLQLLKEPVADSIPDLLEVRLLGSQRPILGQYDVTDDAVLFFPLIAFTEGLNYEISWRTKKLDTLKVPVDSTRKNPEIVSIYPFVTEIPENLLKVHIEFTKPMQEGHSMKYIRMIKNRKDTVPVFLEMEPELWNSEQTILTLWLDPGRTKRGLQPNERRGTPLEKGQHYELLINPGWPDQEGRELGITYIWQFNTTTRDTISPDINTWTISTPKKGSAGSVEIFFNESLDSRLLPHVFSITDSTGKSIEGQFSLHRDHQINFIPEQRWAPGTYYIIVEPRLEDLAGNNLERLFDEDLTRSKTSKTESKFKLSFIVK